MTFRPNYAISYKDIVRGLSPYGRKPMIIAKQYLVGFEPRLTLRKSLDWVLKRSSGPEVLRKIASNSQKQLRRRAYILQAYCKRTLSWWHQQKFCEVIQNSYSLGHLRAADSGSVGGVLRTLSNICDGKFSKNSEQLKAVNRRFTRS